MKSETRRRLALRPDVCPSCGHDRLVRLMPRWLRWVRVIPYCSVVVPDESGWGAACGCEDAWHFVGT